MKDIRIKIRQLGMIGESDEIILNRLMIFSGESGLGKSYLSIICQYIYAVLLDESRISSYFVKQKGFDFIEMRKNYHGNGIAISFTKQDFEDWLSKDAIVWLGYMINNKDVQGDIQITLPDSIPSKIEMRYEEDMSELGNNVETYLKLSLPQLTYTIKDPNGINQESPFAYLFRFYLIQQIFGNFKDVQDYFIFPPSRGTVLTENVEPITGMYVEFKRGIQKLSKAKPSNIKISDKLTDLMRRVLDGNVSWKEGNYIYTTNGTEIPLNAAAASIRELASIEFLVENVDISKVSLMIDEPEAHLHPLKQRLMADIIGCLVSEGAYIQITTHSDYFLRRINELVMKYRLYDKSKSNKDSHYDDICNDLKLDTDLYIDPKMISAYLLERKDKNSSIIKKQDMQNGVPFASFHKALDDSLNIKYQLEKQLYNEND